MATKTYVLVPDDHNILCTRYFRGNSLLIAEESGCRYYMTVHDNGAVHVHAARAGVCGNLKTLKVRCPKCAAKMIPADSAFNSDESQAFRCIFCKK